MNKCEGLTDFAPTERASETELRAAVRAVGQHPMMKAVLDAFSGAVIVLNRQRQIIAANVEALRWTRVEDPDRIVGQRPGEAMHCAHAQGRPGGCGTSRDCVACGAVMAILASQRSGHAVEKDCHISLSGGETRSLELRVRATPFELNGYPCTIVVLQDISDAKRKENLEKVFFHDVLNTVTALESLGKLLSHVDGDRKADLIRRINHLTKRLAREIGDQRDWSNLEAGCFQLQFQPVPLQEIVEEARELFSFHAGKRTLQVRVESEDLILTTDRTLLIRVLANMLKNAAEATPDGDEISLHCLADNQNVIFRVWNRGEIPPHIAARLFERYFSTKGGNGRGLGTYSMKLLGEKYLGGRVTFETSSDGTVFSFALPAPTSAT